MKRRKKTSGTLRVSQGKKTRFGDVLGTIFVVFPPKIGNYWEFLFFFLIINSTMFGILGKIFSSFFFRYHKIEKIIMPQLHAAVGPLEQVGYPLVRCQSRNKIK
jgi:hypothetical protein